MLYFVQNFRNCGDFIPFSSVFLSRAFCPLPVAGGGRLPVNGIRETVFLVRSSLWGGRQLVFTVKFCKELNIN